MAFNPSDGTYPRDDTRNALSYVHWFDSLLSPQAACRILADEGDEDSQAYDYAYSTYDHREGI